jgi:hypothetical protein
VGGPSGPPKLADHGERWDDERIEQLLQHLADIGVQFGPPPQSSARISSEAVAAQFDDQI